MWHENAHGGVTVPWDGAVAGNEGKVLIRR